MIESAVPFTSISQWKTPDVLVGICSETIVRVFGVVGGLKHISFVFIGVLYVVFPPTLPWQS